MAKLKPVPKSPFYIIRQFLSPLMCEEIVDGLGFTIPDIDINTQSALKTVKRHDHFETVLFDRLQMVVPKVEEYYGYKYKGTEVVDFEWFPEGANQDVRCENSTFVKAKKWLRNRDRDFSMVLFLVDYQETVPFDAEFEVFGGKLEFPQHGFGFNPERGTLIMFPSSPHFINATTDVTCGDLFQARFHISAQAPYLYDPKEFPGTYTDWFADLD